MKATITIELSTNRKLNWRELCKAISTYIELDESMAEFMNMQEPIGDFTTNYLRIRQDGIKWEED
jgi:hypothetical protein